MNKNEFDRLLNDKFDQFEFAYDPANWEKLSRRLPVSASRKPVALPWWKLAGVAAAVAIAISGAAWYFHRDTAASQRELSLEQKPSDLPAHQTSLARAAEAAPHEDAPIETSPNNIPAAVFARKKPQATPAVAQGSGGEVPEMAANTETTVTSPRAERATTPSVTPPTTETHATTVATNQRMLQTSPSDNPPVPAQLAQRKTSFSLLGGMNYGSLNTGYTAGISAKQKIGGKLFVQGDLAMVSNTAGQSFTAQQQQTAWVNKAPIDYKEAHLLYVQLNPSVGYELIKNVSVGVGADVQQLLSNDNDLVEINNEVKTIPVTDLGFTGKTEVALSPRLRAGILYRQGVNNLVNSRTDFLDRRYLQIQLKFNVLGR